MKIFFKYLNSQIIKINKIKNEIIMYFTFIFIIYLTTINNYFYVML